MRARVYVTLKKTVLDPQGQTILSALGSMGYKAVKDIRQGKVFEIVIDGVSRESAQKQIEEIAREVLTNPVIEEFRYELE